MALDASFFFEVESIDRRLPGGDFLAPLLYWLVRTVRPARALAIGMSYATPFVAQALADNAPSMTAAPELHVIDPGTDPRTCSRVTGVLERLELSRRVIVHESHPQNIGWIDLCWCESERPLPALDRCWPLLRPAQGLFVAPGPLGPEAFELAGVSEVGPAGLSIVRRSAAASRKDAA